MKRGYIYNSVFPHPHDMRLLGELVKSSVSDPYNLAGTGNGSTIPGSGSADPDPLQDEVDLEHWTKKKRKRGGKYQGKQERKKEIEKYSNVKGKAKKKIRFFGKLFKLGMGRLSTSV